MRVAFLGLPLAALLLDHDGHQIVYAGLCRPGALGTRRLKRRLGSTRVILKPDLHDPRVLGTIRRAHPDLLVSWFWTTRIPDEIRKVAKLGAIGVHPSLLPRHRGPDPCFWAIDSGDAEAGVTAHRLEDAYDTGAILGRRAIAIGPDLTGWALAKKLDRPSLALLREVTATLARGEEPAAEAQDESAATSAPEPTDDDLEIRWTWPSARIERRVRAAAPWPAAFTEIGEVAVALTRVRPTGSYPRALATGEAAVRADGVAVVRTGDGAVELLRGRLEEDDRELDGDDLAEVVEHARGGQTPPF